MLFNRILAFLTSLKLTVACLAMAIVLVFFGTLAQVDLGIHIVQERYFNTFLIFWKPFPGGWSIPVFPGGYLIGSVLLLNLIATHLYRFQLSWKKSGIILIHMGIFILLTGGLLTSLLSTESQMILNIGEAKDYSEDPLQTELVLADTTSSEYDNVTAIPQSILEHSDTIRHSSLPFQIHVLKFYPNSKLTPKPPGGNVSSLPVTQGLGRNLTLTEIPPATQPNEANVVSAIIEIISNEGTLGTWLVSNGLHPTQSFSHRERTWRIQLRQTRYYKPYSIQLLDFTHEQYPGTDIPKNFASRIRLIDPFQREDREVLIYMNNPLRYSGETYYQASFANNDRTSILQVVRNPSWLTPYVACIMVALGLLLQFSMHLTSFIRRQVR